MPQEALSPQNSGVSVPQEALPPQVDSEAVANIKREIQNAEALEASGEVKTIFGIKKSEWLSLMLERVIISEVLAKFVEPSDDVKQSASAENSDTLE